MSIPAASASSRLMRSSPTDEANPSNEISVTVKQTIIVCGKALRSTATRRHSFRRRTPGLDAAPHAARNRLLPVSSNSSTRRGSILSDDLLVEHHHSADRPTTLPPMKRNQLRIRRSSGTQMNSVADFAGTPWRYTLLHTHAVRSFLTTRTRSRADDRSGGYHASSASSRLPDAGTRSSPRLLSSRARRKYTTPTQDDLSSDHVTAVSRQSFTSADAQRPPRVRRQSAGLERCCSPPGGSGPPLPRSSREALPPTATVAGSESLRCCQNQ